MTQYNSPKPNLIKQAFWWCAGADPILLRLGTYSDQTKMACMGGTIFSTAILAFFAGTFAIHTVFSTDQNADITFLEYFFGFVWGVIIFNIDKFIVSSSKPNIDIKIIDKLSNAIPRIIMGVVISLIISKPLELKIFEKDIELEISKNQGKEYQKIKDDIKNNLNNDLKLIDNKLAKLENDIKTLEKQRNNSDSLYKVELRIITVGPRALALKADRDAANLKIKEIKQSSEYKKLIEDKDKLNSSVNLDAEKEKKSVQNGLRSLVHKIELSHEISPTISWMITILFIILELTPIIFKLLMEKSPYDNQMYNRNEIIVANSKILLENNRLENLRKSEEYKKQQDDLHEEFLRTNQRISEEQILKRDLLQEANNEIIKTENDYFLKNSLDKIIDLEQLEMVNKKIKKALELETDNVEIELENYKKKRYLEVEKGLINTSATAYNEAIQLEIKANPKAEYKNMFKGILKNVFSKENTNDKKELLKEVDTSDLKDALKKNTYYKFGENYSYTKILIKDEIRKLITENNIDNIDDAKIQELEDNKLNQCLTDSKITQSKKGNLIDWMNKNNNIEKFELEAKAILDLHKNTQTKMIDYIKANLI